jgi:hypothetical protein
VAKRNDMFGYLDFDGWNEKMYLVKGRKYKVNFLSSETDEKIKITVVYNEHGGLTNAHIGHTINDYLTADDSIQTFVDTTKNSPSSGNYTTRGFKIFIHSKKALNENINNIDKELGNIYYYLDNLSNENSLCKVTDEDIERWNTQIIERAADV